MRRKVYHVQNLFNFQNDWKRNISLSEACCIRETDEHLATSVLCCDCWLTQQDEFCSVQRYTHYPDSNKPVFHSHVWHKAHCKSNPKKLDIVLCPNPSLDFNPVEHGFHSLTTKLKAEKTSQARSDWMWCSARPGR